MGNGGSTRRTHRIRIPIDVGLLCQQAVCESIETPKHKLMLLGFFSASSSGAGEDTDSIFNDLAEKYKDVVTFVRNDVDEMTDEVQQLGIQTTPTFILVKHGQEVDRLVGGDWKELERKIEKLIPRKLEP